MTTTPVSTPTPASIKHNVGPWEYQGCFEFVELHLSAIATTFIFIIGTTDFFAFYFTKSQCRVTAPKHVHQLVVQMGMHWLDLNLQANAVGT